MSTGWVDEHREKGPGEQWPRNQAQDTADLPAQMGKRGPSLRWPLAKCMRRQALLRCRGLEEGPSCCLRLLCCGVALPKDYRAFIKEVKKHSGGGSMPNTSRIPPGNAASFGPWGTT